MKNKVEEAKQPTVVTKKSDLKKTIDTLKNTDVQILPVDDSLIPENEEVIEPKDPATIKYLSNVVDNNTGKISAPFTINDKKYQMVRGINPNKEVVMGVYCFDDMGEDGQNIIHPMEYFEENIAKPMKEAIGMIGQDIQPIPAKENVSTNKSLNLSEYKHFIVNEETGKVKKFKTNEELAKATMGENEKYMNFGEFKKYVEETLFGLKRKNRVSDNLNENKIIKIFKVKDLNNE